MAEYLGSALDVVKLILDLSRSGELDCRAVDRFRDVSTQRVHYQLLVTGSKHSTVKDWFTHGGNLILHIVLEKAPAPAAVGNAVATPEFPSPVKNIMNENNQALLRANFTSPDLQAFDSLCGQIQDVLNIHLSAPNIKGKNFDDIFGKILTVLVIWCTSNGWESAYTRDGCWEDFTVAVGPPFDAQFLNKKDTGEMKRAITILIWRRANPFP